MIKKLLIGLAIFLSVVICGCFCEICNPSFQSLKRETIIKVNQKLSEDSNILGVQIVSTNLQLNTRYVVYANVYDPELAKKYNDYVSKNGIQQFPIFTKDDKSNLRIVRIINHEFVCAPFKESIIYKYIPIDDDKITTVCTISIPPDYGEFKGMVTVFMKDNPGDFEMEQIKYILNNVSQTISLEIKSEIK